MKLMAIASVIVVVMMWGCAARQPPLSRGAERVREQARELSDAAKPWPDLRPLVAQAEVAAERLVEASRALDAMTEEQYQARDLENEADVPDLATERSDAHEDLYDAIVQIEEWLQEPDPILITPFGADVIRELIRQLQQRVEESR